MRTKIDHNPKTDELDVGRMTFIEHLEELRIRIIYCIVAIVVGFVGSFFYARQLFELLMKPLITALPDEGKLAILEITEGFITYLKVAFFAGIFFASPWIFFQIWKFVAPGLYRREKKFAIPFVIASTILFFAGSYFSYRIILPIGYTYLLDYAGPAVEATLSMKRAFSFTMRMILIMGLIFQLPVLVFSLAKLGIITPRILLRFHRYVIVLVFVVAAILTPPDVITQIFMAVPLLLLYEISILIAWVFGKKDLKTP